MQRAFIGVDELRFEEHVTAQVALEQVNRNEARSHAGIRKCVRRPKVVGFSFLMLITGLVAGNFTASLWHEQDMTYRAEILASRCDAARINVQRQIEGLIGINAAFASVIKQHALAPSQNPSLYRNFTNPQALSMRRAGIAAYLKNLHLRPGGIRWMSWYSKIMGRMVPPLLQFLDAINEEPDLFRHITTYNHSSNQLEADIYDLDDFMVITMHSHLSNGERPDNGGPTHWAGHNTLKSGSGSSVLQWLETAASSNRDVDRMLIIHQRTERTTQLLAIRSMYFQLYWDGKMISETHGCGAVLDPRVTSDSFTSFASIDTDLCGTDDTGQEVIVFRHVGSGTRDLDVAARILPFTVFGAHFNLRCFATTNINSSVANSTPIFMGVAVLLIFVLFAFLMYLMMRGRERVRELKTVSRAKHEFMSFVLHEVRNPLQGVSSMLDCLNMLHPPLSADETIEMTEFVSGAMTMASQMAVILNDVMELGRIERYGVSINPKSTNLQVDVIDTLERVYITRAAAKQLVWQLDVSPGVPRTCITDVQRVLQVMQNLLDNAIKFTTDGFVRMSVGVKTGGYVRFCIIDSGCGMTKKQLPLLFKPYSRVGNLDSALGGSGLGLALCSSISSAMNGQLRCASTASVGSMFEFWMPYVPTDDATLLTIQSATPSRRGAVISHFTPRQGPPGDLKGINVLIAEDNIVNNRLFVRILSRFPGTHIDACFNGQQAVDNCKDKDYDIVFMDISMPVMGGIEATKAIRAFNDNVPIIAATAHALAIDRARFLAEGMTDIMNKPFSQARILEILTIHAPKECVKHYGKKWNGTVRSSGKHHLPP